MSAPVRTCAICGARDAVDVTDVETDQGDRHAIAVRRRNNQRMYTVWVRQAVPACAPCLADVEDFDYREPTLLERTREAIRRNPSSTLRELCEVLGVPVMLEDQRRGVRDEVRRAYDAVLTSIRRLVAQGYVTHEGVSGGGRRYSMASAERRAEIDAARAASMAEVRRRERDRLVAASTRYRAELAERRSRAA